MSISKPALKGVLVLSLCLNFFFLGKFGTMAFFDSPKGASLIAREDGRPIKPPQPPHRVILRALEIAYPNLSPEGQAEIEALRRKVELEFKGMKTHMRDMHGQALSVLGAQIFDLDRADQISTEIIEGQKKGSETILNLVTNHFSRLSHEDRVIIYKLFVKK